MATPKALVKPELLAWARKRSGLSVEAAAKKVTVKPSSIAEWESGDERPSIAQLRKIATAYKFPLAVFFLPEPPTSFDPIRDFRRISGGGPSMTPELTIQIRLALERRDVALELADATGERAPEFKPRATQDQDAEDVGAALRRTLKVSVAEQHKWNDPYTPLRRWKEAVEGLGVLVFEFKDVQVTEARGFSQHAARFPVVALNGSDSPAGRCFSLCHELAHLLLRQGGVCEFFQHASAEHKMLEAWCNQVAASVLMPGDAIADDPSAKVRGQVDFDALEELASRFSVSQEAMVVRLAQLKRLPQAHVAEALETLRKKFENGPKTKGQPQQYTLALKRNGTAFSNLVLSAYRAEAITLSDVSNHLELKLKHLGKLQQTLRQRAG